VRVLYITAEVPYPLTSGYLRHFHFLRGLARDHEITHLSLTRRARVPSEAWTALAPFVARLEVFGDGGPARGGRLGRAIRLRRAARELRGAVAERLAAGATDVVVLSGKDTFAALGAVDGVPLVIDVCDAASLRLGGELAVAPWRQRPLLAARRAEIARVERRLVARTPHLLFASARDRGALDAPHGIVVPNGIDVRYWTRRAPAAEGAVVAFSGVMGYRPNHDAALRLVTGVMPRVRARVPGARLVVAGRDPLPALRAAAARAAGVTLTGSRPDLRPHLEAASVYCAPLRFASGIQNKLLEALAMELPVVTTSVAAAGLRVAGDDPPVLVADDDDALAGDLAGLLADPSQRARLGAAGRRYVERHFSWSRSIARVDDALRRAAASAPGGPTVPARLAPAAGSGR
jgi:glycosyltransferase involved in cell wall biosynthesis